MPQIAQKGINDAYLVLENQIVTNPRPGAVHVFMNISSHSSSMYHPQLYSSNVSLFLEDTEPNIKPFGYLTIPAIVASKVATIIVDQDLVIVDQDQFARYNARVLQSETYRVAQRSRMQLKEMAFPKTTVDFNKVIVSKGTYKRLRSPLPSLIFLPRS